MLIFMLTPTFPLKLILGSSQWKRAALTLYTFSLVRGFPVYVYINADHYRETKLLHSKVGLGVKIGH